MTKRIGNKHIAQHRGRQERQRIKADNIAREALRREAAAAKRRNAIKGHPGSYSGA